MIDFTASNGITIVESHNPFELIIHRIVQDMRIPGPVVQALSERSITKRDEDLGRWRWPDDPDYVVYPFAPNNVRVFRESVGKSLDYMDEGWWPSAPSEYSKAARAFFEAHPERKPWEDAKTGEVWLLTTADGRETAFILMNVRESGIVFESHDWRYLPSDSSIKAGRRIWPENAS